MLSQLRTNGGDLATLRVWTYLCMGRMVLPRPRYVIPTSVCHSHFWGASCVKLSEDAQVDGVEWVLSEQSQLHDLGDWVQKYEEPDTNALS